MAAAEREHAEPRKKIEVSLAVTIEQVRALGPHVVAVEPDRAKDPRHLRIEIALVERERLMAALGEQSPNVE